MEIPNDFEEIRREEHFSRYAAEKGKITDGWEKSETEAGVPYYVSTSLAASSWNHPYLQKILGDLNTYNEIKYAAYRTAFKIRHIQTKLHMHQIHLSAVEDTFHLHSYKEGSEDVMSCDGLLSVLTSLYTNIDLRTDVPESTASVYAEVLQNFLIGLYDRDRTGCISVLSVKLALILLCAARLAEKYKAFYKEITDPSTFISVHRFKAFVESIMQLPDILQESEAFGKDIDAAVNSCVNMNTCFVGISEDVFYSWLLREPQTVVWLPTFHRVMASETVRHDTKCNICKAASIIGFRYKCLQCFNFNMCQRCFYTGRTKKNHKVKHPIQEYCLVSSMKVDAKAFIKTIRNNLSKKHRQKARQKYLPVLSENVNTQGGSSNGDPSVPVPNGTGSTDAKGCSEGSTQHVLQNSNRNENRQDSQQSRSQTLHTSTENKENEVPDSGISVDFKSEDTEVMKQEFLSPKQPSATESMGDTDHVQVDSLIRQRRELEKVISQLEQENRKLHKQLNNLKESSDTESNVSAPANKNKNLKGGNYHIPLHVNTNQQKTNVQLQTTELYSSHHYAPSYSPQDHEPLSPISYGPSRQIDGTCSTSAMPTSGYSLEASPLSDADLSPGIHYRGQDGQTMQYEQSSDGFSLKHRYRTSTKDDISILSDSNQDYISSLQNTDLTPEFVAQAKYRRVMGPESGVSHQVEYDSLDDIAASPSHFTLPSFANSLDNLDGQDEMEKMVQRLDKVFPSNLSYSAYSVLDTEEPDEMIQAASTIGSAMSQLVSEAIQARRSQNCS